MQITLSQANSSVYNLGIRAGSWSVLVENFSSAPKSVKLVNSLTFSVKFFFSNTEWHSVKSVGKVSMCKN
jgi:hypothetical protein